MFLVGTCENLPQGRNLRAYEVTFDAAGLPSGVYSCHLEAGYYVEAKRMVVLK